MQNWAKMDFKAFDGVIGAKLILNSQMLLLPFRIVCIRCMPHLLLLNHLNYNTLTWTISSSSYSNRWLLVGTSDVYNCHECRKLVHLFDALVDFFSWVSLLLSNFFGKCLQTKICSSILFLMKNRLIFPSQVILLHK